MRAPGGGRVSHAERQAKQEIERGDSPRRLPTMRSGCWNHGSDRGWRYRFFDDLRDPFFLGTFAPAFRASDKPIAIACFRLVTSCRSHRSSMCRACARASRARPSRSPSCRTWPCPPSRFVALQERLACVIRAVIAQTNARRATEQTHGGTVFSVPRCLRGLSQLPSRITRHDSMSNVTSPIVRRV